MLEKEFQKAREEGRTLTDREKDTEAECLNSKVNELRDKVEWYWRQLNATEEENDDLKT